MKVEISESLVVTLGVASLCWLFYKSGGIPESLKAVAKTYAKELFDLQEKGKKGEAP